ncbi:MAG: transglycosylase SLT domain-containing protein, partial [Atribacterota bacterium]
LFQPRFNIELGCWYLKFLLEKFNQNNILMISGYNAGPGITDKWVETIDMSDMDFFVENIPYKETTEHIKKVIRSYLIYKIIY